MRSSITFMVCFAFLILTACKGKKGAVSTGENSVISVMLAPAGGLGATAGGKCTVTDGDYKGSTGTYSQDSDGNWWCDLDGGTSVECTGGRCADALVVNTPVSVLLDSGILSVLVAKASNEGPSKGGKCRVTAGDHKGKTGTYSQDGDGKWWCNLKGSNTSVECTGGRCANVRVITGDSKTGLQFDVISGLYLDEGKNKPIHCVSLVDKTSGEVIKNICVPLMVTPMKTLAASKNEIERKIAGLVSTGASF